MGNSVMELRGYQRLAVDAGVGAGGRGLVVMACGTGKTLVAQHSVAELLAGGGGRVLVLFPTLGLLEQTYRSWTVNAPFAFDALAVCSQRPRGSEDIRVEDVHVQRSTDPQQVADWLTGLAADAVGVVFGTYQSLPVIADAHELGAPRWSVVICDEAHRLAGRAGKPFGQILDDTVIGAEHRLFYTATPRIHRARQGGSESAAMVVSMDDPTVFGEQVYTLSTREAIDTKVLSPFQIAVIGVTDRQVADTMATVRSLTVADTEVDPRHVAGSIALARAVDKYGLSSILAFHNTINASKQFVDALDLTTHLLADRTPDAATVKAVHVDGTVRLPERAAAAQILAEREPGHWTLVSNARCFSEGIDVPALDAIYFAEPRSSEVDVVQAVGRAIRKNPNHDRPALIVLAVTIEAGIDDPEHAIEESEFRKIRQVLAALEDHDPTITTNLLTRRDPTDTPPTDTTDDDDVDAGVGVLDIYLPDGIPQAWRDSFTTLLLDTHTRTWENHYTALQEFVAEHGHARPPTNYVTADGRRLGQWVSEQRKNYNTGTLPPVRIERLDALTGWVWNKQDAAWEEHYAALQEFVAEHGHARPPNDYWVARHRTAFSKGTLPPVRIERLEALDGWVWSTQDAAWEENFAALQEFVAEHGHVRPPTNYVTADGRRLGRWITKQRKNYNTGTLPPVRIERLEALTGWVWNTIDAAWEENFAALQEFAAEHGHARPPTNYVTADGRRLGQWIGTQRTAFRKGTLDPKRKKRLDDLEGLAVNGQPPGAYVENAALMPSAGRLRTS